MMNAPAITQLIYTLANPLLARNGYNATPLHKPSSVPHSADIGSFPLT